MLRPQCQGIREAASNIVYATGHTSRNDDIYTLAFSDGFFESCLFHTTILCSYTFRGRIFPHNHEHKSRTPLQFVTSSATCTTGSLCVCADYEALPPGAGELLRTRSPTALLTHAPPPLSAPTPLPRMRHVVTLPQVISDYGEIYAKEFPYAWRVGRGDKANGGSHT